MNRPAARAAGDDFEESTGGSVAPSSPSNVNEDIMSEEGDGEDLLENMQQYVVEFL